MNKKWWWYLFIGGIVAGTAGVVTTNPQLQQKVLNTFTPQYMLTTNPQQIPDAVVCNIPLAGLAPSTKDFMVRDPHTACLFQDPPVLGDVNQWAVTNTYAKYNNDLLARVVNDVLICQVPCSNANAQEIQWCNDLAQTPQPSFTIRAEKTC